ncbi:MAG: hypothetical protein FJW39_29930, partial [Acidobacteria bacterium]|nr:hypothetical protein [Acidobacteriota bacterium]
MLITRRSLLSGAAAQAASPKRPNVLFLLADDQRWDTIAALGNSAIRTPNLDRLVGRGTAFRRAFIMGGNQGAVCMPSRAALMTGRPYLKLPRDLTAPAGGRMGECPYPTLPETFGKAGYSTFGTGKWHNGERLYARSFKHGAQIFYGGMSDHDRVPVAQFDPSGRYPRESRTVGSKFSSELFTDAALAFLEQHKGPDPFFAYVAYTAPHDPRTAPEEFNRMYPPDRIKLPPNFLPEHPFDNGDLKLRDEQLAPWPRTPDPSSTVGSGESRQVVDSIGSGMRRREILVTRVRHDIQHVSLNS